ncbi:MAG TPA: hypothetical protein VN179_03925 [Solirubrobacterales bacterium]|nr:hypothetical protein [Solirubrobacterales bacterium]
MPDLVVSGHSGRYSDQQPGLRVPAGSKIVFFVPDEEALTPNDRKRIFDELVNKGSTPGGQVMEEILPDESTYNYACWHAREFQGDSGMFFAGNEDQRDDLDDLGRYTNKQPLWLSEILHRYPNRVIYWVGDRLSHSRKEGLKNSTEAGPGGADGQ